MLVNLRQLRKLQYPVIFRHDLRDINHVHWRPYLSKWLFAFIYFLSHVAYSSQELLDTHILHYFSFIVSKSFRTEKLTKPSKLN